MSDRQKETSTFHVTVARFLVRWRGVFLALMLVLAVIGGMLIPKTRINADLTSNLPDDSPMRHGMTLLEQEFPQMDIRMQTLRILFVSEPPADSLQYALDGMLPGARLFDVRQNDTHTLYHYLLPTVADGPAVKQAVLDRFGERTVVELDDNSGMPDNLMLMIVTGVLVGMVILFLMCPSFIEPLLILLTLAIAILINMGTNALLPSVRLITHTLVVVLQLVLSMDYAIILMNRYRQERQSGLEKQPAMVAAIASAAPAILSSGLTTIVSLLMLIFMRLKIGADLGIVLSKGVLCSLIATFTVLPSFFLMFDKTSMSSRKRVPHLPTQSLARFELRFRIPLGILFVALFAGSWFLQRQTEISYAAVWPTPITKEFPDRNTLLMLYRTDDEPALLSMADSITALEKDVSFISYPSIAQKPLTASELAALSPELAGELPPDIIDLLYYAISHPERKERMRIDQLKPTADSLLALAGQLLPEESLSGISSRFDVNKMMRKLSFTPAPFPMPAPAPSFAEEAAAEPERIVETGFETEDEDAWAPDFFEEVEIPAAAPAEQVDTAQFFTYEQIVQQRTAADMADFLQYDSQQISMVYRIAGAGKKGTLNIKEFFDAVSKKILGNRIYAAMVSAESAAQFRDMKRRVDAVYAAGPQKKAHDPEGTQETKPSDEPAKVPEKHAHDSSTVITQHEQKPVTDTVVKIEPPAPEKAPVEETLSPLERLAEMAFSGKSYTAAQTHRALAAAGIPVKRQEIDLLYLYHGYKTARDTSCRLSLLEVADFLEGLKDNPLVAQYADSTQLARLGAVREQLDGQLGALRNENWSLAVITSDLPVESPQTFQFIENLQRLCKASLPGESYLIGYSQMYKEVKDGFPRELLVLTLLTIAALFLIIAVTFRSVVVPLLLIPTVLMAVWLNVFASGLGGSTMLFLAYLIVQSIRMGATIDYSILFTHYYRNGRLTQDRGASLATAYQSAFHAIMTSGLILILTPWFMTLVISGKMIISILRSISAGALAATLLILLVLPGTLTLMDRWICKK